MTLTSKISTGSRTFIWLTNKPRVQGQLFDQQKFKVPGTIIWPANIQKSMDTYLTSKTLKVQGHLFDQHSTNSKVLGHLFDQHSKNSNFQGHLFHQQTFKKSMHNYFTSKNIKGPRTLICLGNRTLSEEILYFFVTERIWEHFWLATKWQQVNGTKC